MRRGNRTRVRRKSRRLSEEPSLSLYAEGTDLIRLKGVKIVRQDFPLKGVVFQDSVLEVSLVELIYVILGMIYFIFLLFYRLIRVQMTFHWPCVIGWHYWTMIMRKARRKKKRRTNVISWKNEESEFKHLKSNQF
jgi:hypothetical protein